MKIFYSWQSDTPYKIGKSFIRNALDKAVEELSEASNIDEANRLEITQDTQGELGSPPIAETILRKITESDVVVFDLTLIGETVVRPKKGSQEVKKLINSNVAIELGYAQGVHGDEVILGIMNIHYGPPQILPFDVAHKRHPVTYELSPEANPDQVSKALKNLVNQLKKIIQQYAKDSVKTLEPEHRSQPENAAAYWQHKELLIQEDTGEDGYDHDLQPNLFLGYSDNQPLAYMHLWPVMPVKELRNVYLSQLNVMPFATRRGNIYFKRNQYGFFSLSTDPEGCELYGSTQVFNNGEIWGVNSSLLRSDELTIPCVAFEQGFVNSLAEYVRLALDIGYPDSVQLQCGLVNVNNFKVTSHIGMGRPLGTIYKDPTFESGFSLHDPDGIITVLINFFETIYEAAAAERPATLNSELNFGQLAN